MLDFLAKLFGSKAKKDISLIMPYVEKIKEEYIRLNSLSNDELRAETDKLREYYKEHTKKETDDYNTARNNLINNTSINKIEISEMQLKVKNTKKALKEKEERENQS